MSRSPRRRHTPAITHAILLVGLAAISCSRAARQGPDPGAPGALPPPPAVVRSLPVWVEEPWRHPGVADSTVIAAVGRSMFGPRDADNAALDALVDAMLHRVDEARRRSEALHPYFLYRGEFVESLERRLDAGSPDFARLLDAATLHREGRLVHEGTSYSLAYIEADSARGHLATTGAEHGRAVEEAVDIAMMAAEIDNWFGFVRWSRTALEREAGRVALLVLREALGEQLEPHRFAPSRRLGWISVAADTLRASHGWTVHTEFEWGERPPRQLEPRITRHLVGVFTGHGLRVGLGRGCPTPVDRPLVDWPPLPPAPGDSLGLDEEAEEEEEELPPEPVPHHVLRIRSVGAVTRTALASWDADIALTIEARTCDAGMMVTERTLGTLEGRTGRDAQAAYLRALDWPAFDREITSTMRAMQLLPPDELVGRAPGEPPSF